MQRLEGCFACGQNSLDQQDSGGFWPHLIKVKRKMSYFCLQVPALPSAGGITRFFLCACALLSSLALVLTLVLAPATATAAKQQAPAARQPVPASLAPEALPATVVPNPDVYASGEFDEQELLRFIDSMPRFLGWVREHKIAIHPDNSATGKADFYYTEQAAAKVTELGWDAKRFFCLLGRTAAALYLVEEGSDQASDLPKDMPTVSKKEMSLVRKHLGSLLRAGTGSPPPPLSH